MGAEPAVPVTVQTKVYLGGGTHGFSPGSTVSLPPATVVALTEAGHLKEPEAETPAPAAVEAPPAAAEPAAA